VIVSILSVLLALSVASEGLWLLMLARCHTRNTGTPFRLRHLSVYLR
jgi:hypothetical protein